MHPVPLRVSSVVIQSLAALILVGGLTEDATFKTLLQRSHQAMGPHQDLLPASRP